MQEKKFNLFLKEFIYQFNLDRSDLDIYKQLEHAFERFYEIASKGSMLLEFLANYIDSRDNYYKLSYAFSRKLYFEEFPNLKLDSLYSMDTLFLEFPMYIEVQGQKVRGACISVDRKEDTLKVCFEFPKVKGLNIGKDKITIYKEFPLHTSIEELNTATEMDMTLKFLLKCLIYISTEEILLESDSEPRKKPEDQGATILDFRTKREPTLEVISVGFSYHGRGYAYKKTSWKRSQPYGPRWSLRKEITIYPRKLAS